MKLNVAEAQALLVRMHTQLPFLELQETQLLSAHIAAATEWLSSTSAAISAVDPASPDSVSQCRTLLDSADSLALTVPTHQLHSRLETRVWSHRADSLFSTASERGPPLDALHALLRDADALSIPDSHPRLRSIRAQAREADDVVSTAVTALNPKSRRMPLERWEELLLQVRRLRVVVLEEVRVERVVKNTKEWLLKAHEVLDRIRAHTPHSILFDDVEAAVNRVSGKNIALIGAECSELQVLRLLLKMARLWLAESSTCLKQMRTMGGGHGMRSAEYRERHVRVERRQAVEKVQWLMHAYQQPLADDVTAASTITNLLSSHTPPLAPAAPTSPTHPSTSSSSSPSSSPSSFSPSAFFQRLKVVPADFFHALHLLSLPFSTRLSDRLDEISHTITSASTLLSSSIPLTLGELADTIYDLRRVGVDEDDPPSQACASASTSAARGASASCKCCRWAWE